MRLSDVQMACETGAEAIETLPSDKWAGWVAYLLETLESDGDASDDEFRRVLEGVQGDIETRLEIGRW